MTPMKRPLAAAGAAVLLALSLSACGGGAPTDASEEEFCKNSLDVTASEDLLAALNDKDWDKAADEIHELAEKAEDIGTPEGMPDDAREGFELQLDQAKDVSADDLEEAFEKQENPFEEDEEENKDKYAAYNEYVSETCGTSGSE